MKRSFWSKLSVSIGIAATCITAVGQGFPQDPAQPPQPVKPTPVTPPAKPAPAPIVGDPPKLVLSQTEWDFGVKWYGEKCEGDVTLKNEGKGPLTIINVKTSCGCTAAKPKDGGVWQNKVLQPGQSDTLTLSYNTRKAASKVTQTVTIETNDPSQPSVAVQLKGEVKHLFKMAPGDRITFPRLEKESTESQSIELESNMPEQKIALKVKPLDPKIKYDIKLETTDEAKGKYKLTATTRPPMDNGANAAEVVLETGMEQFPEVRIPITAFVSPRVTLAPNKLFISSKATATVQRKVKVSYNASKPIKITSVKATPESIKAEAAPPPANVNPTAQQTFAFHEINVTLPVAAELTGGKGTIEITTDDPSPEYQKLTVEVQVRDIATPAPRPAVPTPPGTPGAAPGAVRPITSPPKPTPGGAPGTGAVVPPVKPAEPPAKPADAPADKPADKPAVNKP